MFCLLQLLSILYVNPLCPIVFSKDWLFFPIENVLLAEAKPNPTIAEFFIKFLLELLFFFIQVYRLQFFRVHLLIYIFFPGV